MSSVVAVGYNSRKTTTVGDIIMPDWSLHDDRPHIPNAETIVAIEENKEFFRKLKEGEVQPRFNNLAEFYISLFSEDEE